ncbi:tyrosine-type recombinase/integrase [Terrihalobacillus insolitus]|uniref:tyrosine-type recombinase/integrase n=1 Tax=Terrihalobacillus insolitus TaxID=2950438 RepID=UPI00233FE016|nr:site-specific integrase [Terrihalobacillus insolitus]MDC3412565.1 site-specific integrase [Terrihalobacillus insolitus]
MASFRKVAKGKYKLTVELGYVGSKRVKKNKTVNATGPREAQKKLTLFEAEILSKHLIDETKLTVDHFYHQWLEKYANDHYGVRTLQETKNIIEKRIIPEFGLMKLKDVKKIHIVNFFDDLKKKGKRLDGKEGTLSSSSIKNVYKALNGLFSIAEEWELIDRNPCFKIKLPKVVHKKSDVYDMKESELLFSKLENEDLIWQLIVQVAAVVGAREGEIAALEEKHLDFKNNTITIEQALVNITGEELKLKSTKTDRARKVSAPNDLMKALKKLRVLKLEQQMEMYNLWKWPGHVFLFSNEFGQPYRPDSISQRWSRFIVKTGLKKIRFHDLRHTSATLLINKGVHAKVIQERLGHSKISTTMDVYGHVLQEAEQSAATHFESLFKKR